MQAKKRNHGSVLCRGLWTDIVVSPYVAFGMDCEAPNKLDEQLFEVHNKGTGVEQNRHVSSCSCLLHLDYGLANRVVLLVPCVYHLL